MDLHPAPIPATAGTSALGTGVPSGPSESRRCICPGDGGANSCCGGHTGAAGTRRQRAASSACRSGPKRGLQARPVLRTRAPAWSRRHRVSAGACGRALAEAALQPRPFFKAGVPDGDLILNVQKRPESESAGLWHPVPWRLWVPTGGGGGSWPSPKPPMGPGIPEELAWGPHGWSAGEPGSCSPAARSSPQARAQPVRRLDK